MRKTKKPRAFHPLPPVRKFAMERDERVLGEWKPVLLSFYPLLAAAAIAFLFSAALLCKFPSAATAAFFIFTTAFGLLGWVLARALQRANTYILTNRRIRREFCFWGTRSNEVPLGSVTNVSTDQDVVGRVFNFGGVLIETPAAGVVRFRGVSDPRQVSDKIRAVIRAHAPRARIW